MLHQDLMFRSVADEPEAVEHVIRRLATPAREPIPDGRAWRFVLAVVGNVIAGSLLIGMLLAVPAWFAGVFFSP